MLYKTTAQTTKQYQDNVEITKNIVFEEQSMMQKGI